jgi:hypothetical protein
LAACAIAMDEDRIIAERISGKSVRAIAKSQRP